MTRFFLTLLAAILVASPAFASDGIVEINQTCAVQTGCFGGDSPGFPVTITGTAGHSYRLTSDLRLSDVNTIAIEIATNDVAIDLAGFRIVCKAFVPPASIVSCSETGSGAGHGIIIDGDRTGITVRGGSIVGMGGAGVALGRNSVVRNLLVSESGDFSGISVGSGSLVEGNTAFLNQGRGITASFGSIVSGNVVYENTDTGIFVFQGGTVSGNTVWDNGNNGIHAADGSSVQRNTVRDNTGVGLSFGLNANAAYRENVITNNTGGTVSGGFDMGDNFCNTNAVCP